MKKVSGLVLIILSITLAGCGGLNFVQLSPDARDFHPSSVAVMPATVGEYESSRDIIDTVVSRKIAETGLFESVVDNATMKTRISSSNDLANDIGGYIQKVNTLGLSDAAAASKLKESLGADALLLTYVTSWGYGRLDGNKIARVGIGIKLIDASRGTVVLKANHELVEEYWMLKPDLAKIADKLVGMLLKEFPIEKASRKSLKKDAMPGVNHKPVKEPVKPEVQKISVPVEEPETLAPAEEPAKAAAPETTPQHPAQVETK